MKYHSIQNQSVVNESSYCNTCELHDSDILLLCGYALVFVVGTLGNSLVLIAFNDIIKGRGKTELLIFFLATCDLASSIISPWLLIYWILTCDCEWAFGIVGCKLIPTLSRVTADTSIGILLIMAIDRCRVIVTPFKLQLSRSLLTKSFLFTIFMSIFCQLFYAKELQIVDGKCIPAKVESPWFKYPSVILLTIRTLSFMLIFCITTVSVNTALNPNPDDMLVRSQKELHTRKAKVVKMLLAMAVMFIITVVPRDLLHLVYTFSYMVDQGVPYTFTIKEVNKALRLLQTSSCIFNVFIYALMHQRFLREVKAKLSFTQLHCWKTNNKNNFLSSDVIDAAEETCV